MFKTYSEVQLTKKKEKRQRKNASINMFSYCCLPDKEFQRWCVEF